MKKKNQTVFISINKIASFSCAHYQNAVNICTALAQAGRFVRIFKQSEAYVVEVYEQSY